MQGPQLQGPQAQGSGRQGPCWNQDGSFNQFACPGRPGMGGPGAGPGMMRGGPQDDSDDSDDAGWGWHHHPMDHHPWMGQRWGMPERWGHPGSGGQGWGRQGWGQQGFGQQGWGQQGRNQQGQNEQRWGMGGQGAMRMVDINGDGTISADEAAAWAEAQFDRLNPDDSDRVSRDAFLALPQRPMMPSQVQALQRRRETQFKAMDRNNDGFVDHDEWMAWHQERYQSADLDKDGKVSPWEFRAAMRRR